MKFLVWHRPRHGPAMAFALPEQGKVTDSASVSGGPWPRPWQELSEKGTGVSWDDYAEQISHRIPYFGRWSVAEHPDGTTAQQALVAACREASTSLAGPAE